MFDQKAWQEFATNNRRRLLERIPEGSAILVRSGDETIRNRDVEYPFRVNSDFQYLTAFSEPDSVMVLKKLPVCSEFTLFLREKDPEKEVWEGRRLGVESAHTMGATQAFSIDELEEQLPNVLDGCDSVFISFSELEFWSSLFHPVIEFAKSKSRQGMTAPTQFNDLDKPLHELRVIKQPFEIDCMRQAAKISVQGHLQAMRNVCSDKSERQLQGDLENGFWQNGAQREAFNSIVAGGENGCILHYTENNHRLKSGDLVLVDAGAEYGFYAGDITTTFPVNGQFTQEQASIYNLVLKAQQAVIAMIKPGVIYDELHKKTLEILTSGLVELGILNNEGLELQALIEQQAYRPYFMHGTGHWLGMDVHDVGDYKQNGQWRQLKAGMVLTVEPGLYLSSSIDGLDKKLHSIGVRIEDDILVTESGYEVLTKGLPRTVEEIETWMKQHSECKTRNGYIET